MVARILLACSGVVLIASGALSAEPDLTACAAGALASLTASDAPNDCDFGWALALKDGLAVVGAPGDSSAGHEFGAAYLYRFASGNWQFEAKLTPGGTSSTDRFGDAVALAGPLLLVGQPFADLAAGDAGAVYVYRQEDGVWVQVQQITAPDARGGAAFGMTIAATAEHVAIAAPRDDTGGECTGAVYLYRIDGGTLVFEQRVSPAAGGYQYFGEAVALDGGRLVIGVPGGASVTTGGIVYVLEYDGSHWSEVVHLTASDAQRGMYFGGSVAMGVDLIVVGAPYDDSSCADPPGWDCGSAYVFQYMGSEWIQETKLVSALGEEHAAFGSALAVTGDEILVRGGEQVFVLQQVGAEWVEQQIVPSQGSGFGRAMAADGDAALFGAHSSSEAGEYAGAAFAFRAVGGIWAEEQKFLPDGSVAHAALGSAVVMDGETAVAGTPLDDGAGLDAGAAYVYAFNGRTWLASTKLAAPDAEPGDQFGTAVALGPGLMLVAPEEDQAGENAGAVYVYAFDGGAWAFETKLVLDGDAAGARFGAAFGLSGDALVVGAPGFYEARGTAYVFRRGPAGWTLESQLQISDRQPGDQFGYSVDICGDTALVGGPFAPVAGAGRALAFRFSGGTWVSDGELGPVSGLGAGAEFGWSVSAAGDLAVVGAPGALGHGSAYRFTRTGPGAWSNVGRLDGASGSRFGCSVDSDDTVIIVGAEQEGYSGHQNGRAHVFIEGPSGWTPAATLSEGYGADDLLGRTVALGGGQAIIGAPGNDEHGLDSGAVHIFGAIADCNDNHQLDACELVVGTSHDFNENGILDECEGVACRLDEVQEFEPQVQAELTAVSLSGAVVVVGTPTGSPSGAVYVYRSNGLTWTQEAQLVAWDAIENDGFGEAVAVRGDRLLVGAPDRREIYWFDGIGYLFRFDGASWVPEERFATPYSGDSLGISVALGDDVLVLGAPFADIYAGHDGAAYVYRYAGGAWALEVEIAPAEGGDQDYFGAALALDGNVLVIGAPYRDEYGTDAGAAYVYRYDGSQWQYEARLTAADPLHHSHFGCSVAVAGDLVVVGTSPALSDSPGGAHAFRLVEGNWVQEACLVPADAIAYDRAGASVATDGHVVLMGVPGLPSNPDYGYTAAFLYQAGGWIEAARLTASDSRAEDSLGIATALDGGRALVSSAPAYSSEEQQMCTAYIYGGLTDCNGNGQLDACELAAGTAADVDGDWILDSCEVVGDVNCDGLVNVFDIDPFVLALVTPDAHQEAFPGCPLANADANGDGAVNAFDIDPFVILLTAGR